MIQTARHRLTAHDILPYLHGVTQVSPNHWMACCPLHADRNPSLSVTQKGDTLLVHCFVCPQEAVWAEILRLARQHAPPAGEIDSVSLQKMKRSGGWNPSPRENECVSVHPYFTVDGKYLFEKRRYERKGYQKTYQWLCRQNGKPVPGQGANRGVKVLYGLLSALDLKPGEWLHIAEGERCVDSLRELGWRGVSSPDGGGKWQGSLLDDLVLEGVDVVIHEDNDKVWS